MKNIRPLMALLIGTGAATMSTTASPQEQPPGSATTTEPPVVRHARYDPHHPIHVGSDYYPKLSVQRGEQGTCYMAFLIEANGSIGAAQLLKSSGYPLLDMACIESGMGAGMLAATIDGKPVSSWVDFPISWSLGNSRITLPPKLEKSTVPRVSEGFELRVDDKIYSRPKGKKGSCVVHTTVDSRGTALDPQIVRSAGSATLDQACLAAITAARFTPELADGKPVADSTDFAIYW